MVAGRLKSRTLRRVKKVAPGGRNIIHYERRKPKAASCPVTGEKLKGVPRELPSKMKNMPKTKKRPERPFGGVLSSKASRNILKNKARQ
jgi:large subunit ribosomal protein L34e